MASGATKALDVNSFDMPGTAPRTRLNRSSDTVSRLADRRCRVPRNRTYHGPPMPPLSATDDDLASRCVAAALALSESAARADFRGPDPFDGLWWHWPKAVVGGRRRRQAVMQLHVRAPVAERGIATRAGVASSRVHSRLCLRCRELTCRFFGGMFG